MKGTLVNVSFDNLGGNSLFGYAQGFNCSHYCRICLAPMEKCRRMCVADPTLLRDIAGYDELVKIANTFEKPDYEASKGVRKYYLLNDIQNFHTQKI